LGKGARHREILARHATRHKVFVASINQVGGNDDLIFDGHSAVLSPDGSLIAAAPGFQTDLLISHIRPDAPDIAEHDRPREALLLDALVLGIRDYCTKTGFTSAILGVSGGIDSALVATLGVLALGARNIRGVAMPGPYSSDHALTDARDVCARLGIEMLTLPIGPAFHASAATLNDTFGRIRAAELGAALPDLTEENLQSRLRGTMIMALSNRTGAIVLTTGNKSEMAVGYCTLYGDMNGGLAVLSDVTKNSGLRPRPPHQRRTTRLSALGPLRSPPIPDSRSPRPQRRAPPQPDRPGLAPALRRPRRDHRALRRAPPAPRTHRQKETGSTPRSSPASSA
jgi:NAD+ synthase (glutamine-hydrolysing)